MADITSSDLVDVHLVVKTTEGLRPSEHKATYYKISRGEFQGGGAKIARGRGRKRELAAPCNSL